MGKKNNVMCSYLEKPEHFADFINGSLYQGRQVLHPSQVKERQTVYSREDKARDVLKMVCQKDSYILIGVEAQESVHYAMPVRCMEYDVLEYKKQLGELSAKYEQIRKLQKQSNLQEEPAPAMSSAEFLSGMRKEDKLNPVTTIVFFHGIGEYDGCVNLHDMLNFEKENEIFKQFISNYHINLVTLQDLNENYFQTGIRELIGFIKRSTNKDALRKYCSENEQRIMEMDEDTFDTVNAMIDWPYLITLRNKNREGDKITMCQAVKEWEEELLAKGEEKGREQGIEALILDNLEEGVSDARIIEKLQKRFGLDAASAQKYFMKYASGQENV